MAAARRCASLRAMCRATIVKLLSGARLAIGVGAWLAPARTVHALGLEAHADAQLSYLTRLAGARDVALAYGALTSAGEARRRWLIAALAADAADAAAGMIAGAAGHLSKPAAIRVSIAGAGAAVLGAIALGES